MRETMYIRSATERDIPAILEIYERARQFMRQNGNPTQWTGGYPDEGIVRWDMERGCLYVCVEGEEIVGAFAFIPGEDPTYNVIKDGSWRSDEPYAAIHRLASAEKVKGIAKACFDFCRERCPHLRVDTHRDNKPMQAALRKYGFKERGIIYIQDGTERIAFDYLAWEDGPAGE